MTTLTEADVEEAAVGRQYLIRPAFATFRGPSTDHAGPFDDQRTHKPSVIASDVIAPSEKAVSTGRTAFCRLV